MQTRTKATIGLAVAAVILAGSQVGSNDEMDQAAGLYALLDGHLAVEDHPDAIYQSNYRGDVIHYPPRYLGPNPVGSTVLNLAAYPAAKALDAFLPRADAAVLGLQATNLALFTATAWLLWTPIRARCRSDEAALTILLATCLGPLMFWGQALKYHAAAAFLAAATLNRLDATPTWPNRFQAAAFAGLAISTHPPSGAVIVAALAACELRRAWKNRNAASLAVRWAPMLVGGLLGCLPFLAEALAGQAAAGPVGGAAYAGRAAAPGFDAADYVLGVASGYVVSRAEGNPVPVLWLSPLLVAAVLARRLGGVEVAAVAAIVAHAATYGPRAIMQGFGADMRFYSLLLPFLGILAAKGIGNRIPPGTLRWTPIGLVVLAAAIIAAEASPIGNLQGRGYHITLAAASLSAAGMLWILARLGITGNRAAAATLGIAVAVALPALWALFQAGVLETDPSPWRHYSAG